MLLGVGADAFQEGHIAAGSAVVVALQRRNGVGIGANNSDGLDLRRIEGQDAVVLQQHHGLLGSGQRQGVVLVGVVVGEGDGVVLAVICQHTQQDAAGEHALAGKGDVLFRYQTLLVRLHHVQIGVAAVQVAAHLQRQRSGFGRGVGDHVAGMEVADGPAVAGHVAFKAPLVAQDVHQQGLGAAGGLAVDAVVSTHEGFNVSFLHRSLKGRQVGLPHVLLVGDGVKLVTDRLRAGVHRKVLGAGSHLQVLAVALQALDVAHAQAGGQIGILTVGFVAAAPAGITEDVDVGAPHAQALINIAVLMNGLAVVLGARLMADDLGDLLMEVLIENSCQTDSLGEHGGRAGAGNAMECLIPPVVSRDAQMGDRRGVET